MTLYGDEAVRETLAFPFVCISLVGGSGGFVKGVCDKVTMLKNQLEPERDPRELAVPHGRHSFRPKTKAP